MALRSTGTLGGYHTMSTSALVLPLVLGGLLLTCVLLLAYVAYLHLSFGRLRDSHNATWQGLGKPHVFSLNGATYPARKFLWSKQCQALGDQLLVRHARSAYFFGMAAAVLGLTLIGALAVGAAIKVM